MGQSLGKNYIHIVFSTKHRARLIYHPINIELYKYIGGICNNMESYPIKIGGYTDHVHILCNLSRKVALSTLVEKIKSHSSQWMKTKSSRLNSFYWQNGYAAFSVNPAQVDIVSAYIENQEEHHSRKNFEVEYREFMEEYKIEFDERYVWD